MGYNNTAYLFCMADSDCQSGTPRFTVSGGTEASSAVFAGAMALVVGNQISVRGGSYPANQNPGVGNANFLRTALNALRRSRGESQLDAVQFLKIARAETKRLAMPDDMLRRNVNVGFSGGEKKRNEVLQMAILRPRLAILDETDSGLDIDALKIVADGVNALRSPDRAVVVITHYQRLLDYIVPDTVHVLYKGQVIKSGDKTLAHELEANGYADIIGAAA